MDIDSKNEMSARGEKSESNVVSSFEVDNESIQMEGNLDPNANKQDLPETLENSAALHPIHQINAKLNKDSDTGKLKPLNQYIRIPVVYTTRLEEMSIFKQNILFTKQYINNAILHQSKPKFNGFVQNPNKNKKSAFFDLQEKLETIYNPNKISDSKEKMNKREVKKVKRTSTEPRTMHSHNSYITEVLSSESDSDLGVSFEESNSSPDIICLSSSDDDDNVSLSALKKKSLSKEKENGRKKPIHCIIFNDWRTDEYEVFSFYDTNVIQRTYKDLNETLISSIDMSVARMVDVCCWYRREDFIQSLSKKQFGKVAKQYMSGRHNCTSEQCTCCCRPGAKENIENELLLLAAEAAAGATDDNISPPLSEFPISTADNIDSLFLENKSSDFPASGSNLNQNNKRIEIETESTVSDDWLQDLLSKTTAQETLIGRALRYSRPKTKADKTEPSRRRWELYQDQSRNVIFVTNQHEFDVIGHKDKKEHNMTAKQLAEEVLRLKPVCCWLRQETCTQTLGAMYPNLGRFMISPHPCMSQINKNANKHSKSSDINCTCCCKKYIQKHYNVQVAFPNSLKHTQDIKSKMKSIVISNIAKSNILHRSNSTNKNTMHFTQITNEPSTSLPSLKYFYQPNNTQSILQNCEPFPASSIYTGQYKFQSSTPRDISLSHLTNKSEQVNMIQAILNKFKNIRLLLKDEKVAVEIDTPLDKLSVVELRVLSRILAQAQYDNDKILQRLKTASGSNKIAQTESSYVEIVNTQQSSQLQKQSITDFSKLMFKKSKFLLDSFSNKCELYNAGKSYPKIGQVFTLNDANFKSIEPFIECNVFKGSVERIPYTVSDNVETENLYSTKRKANDSIHVASNKVLKLVESDSNKIKSELVTNDDSGVTKGMAHTPLQNSIKSKVLTLN